MIVYGDLPWTCADCGHLAGTTFAVEWELSCPGCHGELQLRMPATLRWDDVTCDLQGVWRYAGLLPVTRRSADRVVHVGLPEFGPLVDAPELADLLGVRAVALLPCTLGPSGTFKDVEAALVIAKCLDWEFGGRTLSWHSTGNTARAYRAYATKAGLRSCSFYPLACQAKWRGERREAAAPLAAFDGPFQELSATAKSIAARNGWLHLAPLRWKLEGKAPLAYAIAEGRPSATIVVQTIAGGYGPLGMHLGFRRLRDCGLLLGAPPRFELFQIEGADTIARLLPLDREITTTDLRLPMNPFEPTLQSTNPLATFNLVRNVILDSGSSVTSVPVEDVVRTADEFAGVCARLAVPVSYDDERSPFIAWAGLRARAAQAAVTSEDEVVFVVTGSPPRRGAAPQPDRTVERE